MTLPRRMAVAASCALTALGCGLDHHVAEGAGLEVRVAALELAEVADAVWTLHVATCVVEAGACTRVAGPSIVEVTLASSRFGDGGGSLTYVAPCDASSMENLVSVRLDALTSATGAALTFHDPGLLSRWVPCVAGVDTPVRFDVAVLRPAQQGFVDVAVSFNDLFCAAKYDCGAHDLLHDPVTGGRGRTHVFGFACAAGGEGEPRLFLDDLTLTCGDTAIALPAPTLETPAGNQGAAGPPGEPPWLYQWAVFRGDAPVDGLPARYLNVALGIGEELPVGCSLSTRGTADRDASPVLEGTTLPAGVVYPVITWSIPDLAGCAGIHALDAEGSGVYTEYSATDDAGRTFDSAPFTGAGGVPGPPIVTEGLILHLDAGISASYPGDGDTWFDLSGHGHHGALVGAPTFGDDAGGALAFDGVADRVETAIQTVTSRGVFDIWYRSESPARQGVLGFLDVHNLRVNLNYRPGVGGPTVGVLGVNFIYGVLTGFVDLGETLYDGAWHNIVVVWDGPASSIRILFDGVERPVTYVHTSAFHGVTNATGMAIGQEVSGHPFAGSMASVRYYDRILDDAELAQNFEALRARFGP